MNAHPYASLPFYAHWRKAISEREAANVDPVVRASFSITPETRIATAGSCFAQHIARHLKAAGFNFLVTEKGHPMMPDELSRKFGYGLFSARYGNIYSSRQLLQLMQRAYGDFVALEDAWPAEGGFIDPFRPLVQPGGFQNARAYEADRNQHYAAVRRALEELHVFVFTLGLTECWASRVDGAVYPLCPGVAGGTYDPRKHEFLNLGVQDVVADMEAFVDRLRTVNPKARVILTVSPVPLIATALDRHVLVSTAYSKSVLRVACEEIVRRRETVVYFPAYEIVTGCFNRGRYFANDGRSVTEEGVSHVMGLFFQHYAERIGHEMAVDGVNDAALAARKHLEEMEDLVEVDCDEEMLGRAASAS